MALNFTTIRANLKDLLAHRGDDVSYIEEHGDAINPGSYTTKLTVLTTDSTVVFFAMSGNALAAMRDGLKRSDKKTWVADFTKDEGKQENFIVIHDGKLPVTTEQIFVKHDIEMFSARELMYNPLRHVLVPPHRKLSVKEAAGVLKEYGVTDPHKLPLISREDVIARWLGLRPGDMVEIERNYNAGFYKFYRVCV
jgi:DNA-directed RNA polymerase subunit H (RpoH/RPB5)